MSENSTKVKDNDEHYDRRSKNADETFCQSCGAIIKTAAEVCPKCGVRQNPPVSQTMGSPSVVVNVGRESIPSYLIKSRMTAALLAFFLGNLGVHKFYMGQNALGILYLLFCWTWIPALIAFVEGIMFLMCTTDEEFTLKYVLNK